MGKWKTQTSNYTWFVMISMKNVFHRMFFFCILCIWWWACPTRVDAIRDAIKESKHTNPNLAFQPNFGNRWGQWRIKLSRKNCIYGRSGLVGAYRSIDLGWLVRKLSARSRKKDRKLLPISDDDARLRECGWRLAYK